MAGAATLIYLMRRRLGGLEGRRTASSVAGYWLPRPAWQGWRTSSGSRSIRPSAVHSRRRSFRSGSRSTAASAAYVGLCRLLRVQESVCSAGSSAAGGLRRAARSACAIELWMKARVISTSVSKLVRLRNPLVVSHPQRLPDCEPAYLPGREHGRRPGDVLFEERRFEH